MNNNSKSYRLAMSGICAALVFTFTWLVKIPLPMSSGYFNCGDIIIFASAFIMPVIPHYVAAIAIGSALADIIGGFVLYAPVTFAVKALVAFLTVTGVVKVKNPLMKVVFIILAVMSVPLGYFIFDALLYGISVAVVDIPFNLLQSALGAIAGTAVGKAASKRARI